MAQNWDGHSNMEYIEIHDLKHCQARQLSDEGYELVECLAEGNSLCTHAITFGYRCLCRHPQRQEIVEKTETSG
jgi:hypothetical protein